MARVKSEEKRAILVNAATKVFASKGLSASTASISAEAGLAEGTLFIYFKGKDDLINSLYVELKTELSTAMLAGFPESGDIREQVQHVWNNYVDWGGQNRDRLETMHKIKVWEGLNPEVADQLAARFAQLYQLTENAIKQGVFNDTPFMFLIAMLSAQAETTMNFIRQFPGESEEYKKRGFEVFWNGFARRH